MHGTLAEFTLAQLMQMYALAEKSGVIEVTANERVARVLIESERVIGLGADGYDIRGELLSLDFLPTNTRSELAGLTPRPEAPGLSHLAAGMLDPTRWDRFTARHVEQHIYPVLNAIDGEFQASVERCPPVPIRVNLTIQQLILDCSRWEAETEALRAEGYDLDSRWCRLNRESATTMEFDQISWLLWSILTDPMSVRDAAQRVGVPELTAASGVRHLHRQRLIQTSP